MNINSFHGNREVIYFAKQIVVIRKKLCRAKRKSENPPTHPFLPLSHQKKILSWIHSLPPILKIKIKILHCLFWIQDYVSSYHTPLWRGKVRRPRPGQKWRIFSWMTQRKRLTQKTGVFGPAANIRTSYKVWILI